MWTEIYLGQNPARAEIFCYIKKVPYNQSYLKQGLKLKCQKFLEAVL